MAASLVFRNRLDPENVGALVIAWDEVTPTKTGTHEPSWVGYTTAVYDAVSGKTLWYLPRSPNTIIYGTDIFAYDATSEAWTWLGGTGTEANPGGDGSDAVDFEDTPISPWPPDRHPIEQMAIDTSRNRMYLSRGVANTVDYQDLHYYAMNADPTDNRWTEVDITGNVPTVANTGSMVYSPDDDVFILHGTNSGAFPRTYVFGPGTGDPSAAQLAAGVVTRNTWAQTYTIGSVIPPQSAFNSLVYLPSTGTVLQFSHFEPAGEVWEYDIQAKTWTELSPSGQPSEPDTWLSPERSVSYISAGPLAGKVFYHQTSHSTSPSLGADWIYDRELNAWTQLPSTGTGPRVLTTQAYDPTLGAYGGIVAWTYGGTMWHGVFE